MQRIGNNIVPTNDIITLHKLRDKAKDVTTKKNSVKCSKMFIVMKINCITRTQY